MTCKCGGNTKVVDTAPDDRKKEFGSVYRIRKCDKCGMIFSTLEYALIPPDNGLIVADTIEDTTKWVRKHIVMLKAVRRLKND